jgi:hypothetical protein
MRVNRRSRVVADAGLFNKKNLDMLDALEQPYIVAARLKGMPQALQQEMLDLDTYQPLREAAAATDAVGVTWRELAYEGQRLLVTHSPLRAHVGLCFMALTCIRWLTHTCAVRYERLSAEVIRNELMHVQASIVEDQKSQRRYVIPSRPAQHARQLYKLVNRRLSAVPFEINGDYPNMA